MNTKQTTLIEINILEKTDLFTKALILYKLLSDLSESEFVNEKTPEWARIPFSVNNIAYATTSDIALSFNKDLLQGLPIRELSKKDNKYFNKSFKSNQKATVRFVFLVLDLEKAINKCGSWKKQKAISIDCTFCDGTGKIEKDTCIQCEKGVVLVDKKMWIPSEKKLITILNSSFTRCSMEILLNVAKKTNSKTITLVRQELSSWASLFEINNIYITIMPFFVRNDNKKDIIIKPNFRLNH